MPDMQEVGQRLRGRGWPLVAGFAVVVAGLLAAIILANALSGARFGDGGSGPGDGGNGARSGNFSGTVAGSEGWRPVGWSPDGSALLVRRERRFAVVDAAGRLEALEAEQADWWPGDARTLSLVVRGPDAQRNLVLRSLRGGPEQAVIRLAEIDVVGWSPDGQTFAVSGTGGIFVGLTGAAATRLTPTRTRLLSLSAGGSLLAYRDRAGRGESGPLAVVDLLRNSRSTLPGSLLRPGDALAWGPGGRFLAFTGSVGDQEGLFLFSPAAVSATLILAAADPGSVRWSPNGLWLAAARLPNAGPTSEIVAIRVRPDGVQVRPLGPGRATAWRPDGEFLLTVDPTGALVGYPLDGEGPTTVASDADPRCAPAWSEGPERIAYCSSDGRTRVIDARTQ
jgi:hypothetical protein